MSSEPLRPRDLAVLLLASGDLLPRRRARDQQADLAGLQLKRQVLERLAELDPEPAELEGVLLRVVEEIGPPTGPTRAVAVGVLEDWQAACTAPEWVSHLLEETIRQSSKANSEAKP